MELHISEIEQIPENIPKINVIKKTAPKIVKFDNQSQVKPPSQVKPQISYDDILSNMGMYVKDGKVHTYSKSSLPVPNQVPNLVPNLVPNQVPNLVQSHNIIPEQKHSYIYNKYFKDDIKQETSVRVPKSLLEYRNMLIQDILQKERVKRVKSTKILLPNTNMNTSGRVTDLNKLFKFSHR